MNFVLLAQASPATGTNPPAAGWDFGRLLELRVENWELVFTLGPVVLLKLVEDLKQVQGDLVKHGEFLRQVAQGKAE